MENKDQILAEILFSEPSKMVAASELQDYEIINRMMQVNLLKENFDIDYETGYFNDSVN